MEDQSTVGMTEETGVTAPGVDAPTDTAEASPTPAQEGENEEQEQEEEILSIPKKEYEQRIKNLRMEQERKLRSSFQKQYQEEFQKKYADAIYLDGYLRKNSHLFEKFQDLIRGGNTPPQNQTPEQDPYAEFDPVAAENFRTVQELKQWKLQLEQKIQEQQQQTIQRQQEEERKAQVEAQGNVDEEYLKLLKKDGFVDSSGHFVDENYADLINFSVLSKLIKIAKDPYKPSRSELDRAYTDVMQGLTFAEKRGLKKAVKTTVPLSGSNKGALPKKSGPRSEEERLSEMVQMMEG